MLQELAGLARTNNQLYLDTLSAYESLTVGQILQPTNKLLIYEGEHLEPLGFSSSLLDKQSTRNILTNMKLPNNAVNISYEAQGLKKNHGDIMENARKDVLSVPTLAAQSRASISAGYKKWFDHFPEIIQSWFVGMFKVKRSFPVNQLPHVSAFLGYAVTRVYESNVLNIKDRDNDFFDRSYFSDAAVVDILVTNDRAFTRTSLRVPNRPFEVLNTDELSLLIDNLNA